jgi:hypothetical protein
MQEFFIHSMRTLRRPQSCVLCVNITREVEPGLICKEGNIKNINSFRLNKIYRVIQEESAILWKMIVCVILSKNVHINMCPIFDGYGVMTV